MFSFLKKRVTLLGFLALACAVALHYQTKADSLHQTIFPKDSIFYTPGQHSNCQWVVHISDRISTQSGNTSPGWFDRSRCPRRRPQSTMAAYIIVLISRIIGDADA